MIETTLTVAAVISALAIIGGVFLFVHKILKRFEKLEKEGTKRKGENVLIIKGIIAICTRLQEQGANGVVSNCLSELQDYIIRNC